MFKNWRLQRNVVWFWNTGRLHCISLLSDDHGTMVTAAWQKVKTDKMTRACCFLCLLVQFHGGSEQAVWMQRVKLDMKARHLSDSIRVNSFHFIALHALRMQTPCCKLPLFHVFHSSSQVHHCLCGFSSAPPLEFRLISSGKGIRVIVPWPWAQPPLALLLFHQTQPPS